MANFVYLSAGHWLKGNHITVKMAIFILFQFFRLFVFCKDAKLDIIFFLGCEL